VADGIDGGGDLLGAGIGRSVVRWVRVMDICEVNHEIDRIIDEFTFSSLRLGMNDIEVMEFRLRLERLSSEIEYGCGYDFPHDVETEDLEDVDG